MSFTRLLTQPLLRAHNGYEGSSGFAARLKRRQQLAFTSPVGSVLGQSIRPIIWIGLVCLLAAALLSACDDGSSPAPTDLPTNTPAPNKIPTQPPSDTPAATPVPKVTPKPTATLPVPTPEPTPTRAPTATPTTEPTPTQAPTATPTPEPTPTQAPTVIPTLEPTPTQAPTATPTQAPTATPTQAPTATPTPEPTATNTPTVTPTPMPVGHSLTNPIPPGETVTTRDGLGITIVSATLDATSLVLNPHALNQAAIPLIPLFRFPEPLLCRVKLHIIPLY